MTHATSHARLLLLGSAALSLCFASMGALGCADLREIKMPKMPWDHPSIVEVAPKASMLPLVLPSDTLKGDKGPAQATYPASFTATIRADGTITFPEGPPGKVKGASILVGGSPIVTLSAEGEVSGNGLKRKYKFAADGDLLDGEGHGLRIAPDGGVRAIGGPYHYKDVMVWAAPVATPYDKPSDKSADKNASASSGNSGNKSSEGAAKWDRAAWRTAAIVSILMIENLLPDAIGR